MRNALLPGSLAVMCVNTRSVIPAQGLGFNDCSMRWESKGWDGRGCDAIVEGARLSFYRSGRKGGSRRLDLACS